MYGCWVVVRGACIRCDKGNASPNILFGYTSQKSPTIELFCVIKISGATINDV